MTSRPQPARFLRWASITAALIMLLPASAFATHFELSRLASQIELISGQLAHELRYTRHYGPVRQRAVKLSREASQLVDTLRRNRSSSRVRSQFKDVRRGYERLERAYFDADRRRHYPELYREINLLSDLFTNLSDEYYYAGFGSQYYGTPVIVGGRSSIIVGSRNYGDRNYRGGRNQYNGRDRYRGDRGSRQSGRIVAERAREIPQAFRGNSGRVAPNRTNQTQRPGRGRVEGGSRVIQGVPNADHRSPVLERQNRQEADRRELERQARQNRPADRVRQSPQGNRGDRNRRGRGVITETDRRNHYD